MAALIDWSKVSSELRAALEKKLPKGTSLDENIRVSQAHVTKFVLVDDKEAGGFQAAFEQAGGPAMITNGRPTIIRVVAWLAHEGINKNRLAFVKEDLTQAAAKIRQPDFLPMDFNHSAIEGWGFDQKAIGVWYAAEMVQDPEADNAWGVLATGMMWAWLNPELADRLLAEQARNGRIDFSMACVAGIVTKAKNDDGPYEIAGDTTFFTLSALDVPPADPNATGLGVEGSEDPNLEADLKRQLTAAALKLSMRTARAQEKTMELDALVAQLKEIATQMKAAADKVTDPSVREAILKVIDERITEATKTFAKVAELQGQLKEVSDKLEMSETAHKELTDKLAAAEKSLADMAVVKAELETKVATIADKDTSLEAAKTELEKANTEVERLGKELEAIKTSLKTFEDTKLASEAAEKAKTRYAELPAAYREAFEKKDEKEQTEARARWAAFSDEAWKAFVTDLGLMPVAKSYFARSKEEVLPTASANIEGTAKRLAQYRS